MHFRRRRIEEPEINLIPFIDVLLVVLIFVMMSSTLSPLAALQIQLPQASADPLRVSAREVTLSISKDGHYSINKVPVPDRRVDTLSAAMTQASVGQPDTVVIIHADAQATHQSVLTVMEAARRSGLAQISFATQTGAK